MLDENLTLVLKFTQQDKVYD